jgi:hypothetical protein
MKDELNIREIYNNLIRERASANGVVLAGDVNIPSQKSTPDALRFDGHSYDYDDNQAKAFSLIGQTPILAHSDSTHPYIFNALTKLSQDPKNKKVLKDYGVKIFGKMSTQDLEYFSNEQKDQSMGATRINTSSGRIWFNVPSPTLKKSVAVVSFWGTIKRVDTSILQKIKDCFGVDEIWWVATDSKSFTHYSNTYKQTPSGNIKEFKSKIYPELSHADIVDILMRAHSGFRMTPFEKKVVWEFRGFNPSEVKHVTGGYPTAAEYDYRRKLSEDTNNEY